MDGPFRQILGVRFYIGDLAGLLERLPRGGLVVAPAAPALVRLDREPAYREALEASTLAVTDSGLLVLLWLFTHWQWLPRLSGLRLLRALLKTPDFCAPGATFWVMPSPEDAQANAAWLRARGIQLWDSHLAVAPQYGEGAIADPALVRRLEQVRPRYVVLCIAGGVQERLGSHLQQALSFRPAILCTGAAIAFLSGRQVKIPAWADRFMLGWAFRICSAPGRYGRRYASALRLLPLLLRHGSNPVR